MEPYSVLMSVYAKEKPEFLQKSLESMENQTISCSDFVIVCDGPLTRDLNRVLDTYAQRHPNQVQLVPLEKNVGLGQALNIGLAMCKCELVARMDSDDIAFPERCEKQLMVFASQPVDIVGGTVLEFTATPEDAIFSRKLPERHEDILKFARRRNPFNHSCVMFRKSAVLSVGSYQHFYLCEDYYLWTRMMEKGMRGYNLQAPILYMRAGSEMYQRRGGWKLLKAILSFQWMLKKRGFSSWSDFLISAGGRILTCLLPCKLRQKILEALLREKI